MVDHLLYLGWPDFDVPSDPDGFLNFLDAVNRLIQSRSVTASTCNASSRTESSVSSGTVDKSLSPMLIHCSAGIGRTGKCILSVSASLSIVEGLFHIQFTHSLTCRFIRMYR